MIAVNLIKHIKMSFKSLKCFYLCVPEEYPANLFLSLSSSEKQTSSLGTHNSIYFPIPFLVISLKQQNTNL